MPVSHALLLRKFFKCRNSVDAALCLRNHNRSAAKPFLFSWSLGCSKWRWNTVKPLEKAPNLELAPTSNKITHVLIEFRFSDFKTTRTHVGICETSKYFTRKQVRWPPIFICCFNILLELKRAAGEKMKKFYRRKFLLNKNVLFSPFAKSLIFFFFGAFSFSNAKSCRPQKVGVTCLVF